jgi:hypothetical protein
VSSLSRSTPLAEAAAAVARALEAKHAVPAPPLPHPSAQRRSATEDNPPRPRARPPPSFGRAGGAGRARQSQVARGRLGQVRLRAWDATVFVPAAPLASPGALGVHARACEHAPPPLPTVGPTLVPTVRCGNRRWRSASSGAQLFGSRRPRGRAGGASDLYGVGWRSASDLYRGGGGARATLRKSSLS